MIWIIIFSSLFGLLLVLSKCVFGTIKNPISVFCLSWCVIGIGSNAAFYDYYEPSMIVNIMIFIGCIIAFIIYGFSLQGYRQKIFVDEIRLEDEEINIDRIIVVNLLGIGLIMPYLVRSLKVLALGGFAVLRAQDVIDSGFFAILNDSIIRPVFVATTVLAIVYSFSNAKKRKKILLIVLVIIANIEQVALSAGRSALVGFAFYLMIAVVAFHGRNIRNILYRGRKYICLGIVAAIVVLKITAQRNMSSDENMLLYNTYVYYFSGPSYLTQLIRNVTEYGPGGKLLYGGASFGFLTNIFSDIMIFITGKAQGSLYLLGSVITNKQYNVGTHTSINAMYTCFYPFLIDYGWMGIIICPIFIAVVSAIVTKRLYKCRSIFNVSLYIYWIYVIIRTVFKWDLVNLDFTVVIVTLYFFTKHSSFKQNCVEDDKR